MAIGISISCWYASLAGYLLAMYCCHEHVLRQAYNYLPINLSDVGVEENPDAEEVNTKNETSKADDLNDEDTKEHSEYHWVDSVRFAFLEVW